MQWIPELEQSFEYDGVVDKSARAATQAAKGAVTDATTAQNTAGQNATNEHGLLMGKANEWMNTQHAFEPGQLNELLTFGMGGLGGAASAAQNQSDMLAANTRNQSGFTKSLQEQARDRMKAAAGMSEGIAAQDVAGAKDLNNAGVGIMSNLFGQDTNSQLAAMGQRNAAINTQIDAGKSGWLQNMNETIKSIGSLGPKIPGFGGPKPNGP